MAAYSFWYIAYFALVVTLSFTVRGATGFGGNVISIPLLALVSPVTLVIPAFAAVGIIAGTWQIIVSWQDIVWTEIRKSTPLAIVGLALGLLFFKQLSAFHLIDKLLGIFIFLYAAYSLVRLLRLNVPAAERSHVARGVASFLVGFLGAIFGQGGQLYAVYLDHISLKKAELRATLSFFLVFTTVIRLIGYVQTGFFTGATLAITTMALPAMVVGMLLGQHLHIKASNNTIRATVLIILLLSGFALII